MDDEPLQHMRKMALKNVKYYSNSNKEVRERWAVSEFLSIIGIEHNDDELHSLEQKSKVDVCFREAQFQVKELTDPKLRRGEIYKSHYKAVMEASSIKEVSWGSKSYPIPTVSNMYELILKKTRELSYEKKYQVVKGSIDLLIYVTRTRSSLIQEQEINSEDFSSLGWRSVSCVNAKQAVVIYSAQSAPNFIFERSQQLINKIVN